MGTEDVGQVAGIFLNETLCVNANRTNELTQLFDIPREKRVTCKLFLGHDHQGSIS